MEDYAVATLTLRNGPVVRLACSWRVHAGCDAEIGATFFGTNSELAMRNVGGSFYDFRTDRFRGTCREMLLEPPDEWVGSAAAAWTRDMMLNAKTCERSRKFLTGSMQALAESVRKQGKAAAWFGSAARLRLSHVFRFSSHGGSAERHEDAMVALDHWQARGTYRMRILPLATLALLAVTGCTTVTPEERRAQDEAQCRSYGFTKRNDAFAQCLQRLDLDRRAARRDLASVDPWPRAPRTVVVYRDISRR